jgi:hypothetical protein
MNKNALVANLRRFRTSAYFWPALVVLFVLAANILFISGIFDANPINERSDLASSMVAGPISGQYTIDPSDGFYAQSLGHAVASDAAHGHMPWWNYNEGVGAPLAGGLQSGSLFPLQFLLLFANGLFYFHLCLEVITALGAFYFLKRLKCRDDAAALGAMAFSINGTYAWITHTIFNPIAFLPLLLLGIEITLDKTKGKRPRGWFVIALAVACTIYANFPETGYIDTLFAGLWALVRMTSLNKDQYVAYLKKLILGAVVGIAIAAPLLVAFVDYLPQANVGLHATNTSHIILPHAGIAGLIMPYIYGQIFANGGSDATGTLNLWWGTVGGFLSLSLIFFALIALTTKTRAFRRADKVYLAAWSIFCIFATYGILGFNQIAGRVPGLSSSAFARYFPPTYEFAITVLAAMGLSYVFEHRNEIKHKQIMAIAGALFLLIIWAVVFVARPELHNLETAHHIHLWFKFAALWAGFIVAGIAVSLRFIRTKLGVVMLVLVLLADFTVPYVIPMLSAPRSATIDTAPVTFLQKNLGFSRFYSMGPILPNYGTYFGIASVNINDIPQAKTYSSYITNHLDPNVNPITFTGINFPIPNAINPPNAFFQYFSGYEFLGVKYVVVYHGFFSPQQVAQNDLRLVFNDKQVDIYELPNVGSYATVLNGNCTTSVQWWNKITVDCKMPSTIVRREQYLNGWTAKIDGKKTTPIKEYANLFQEVNVPAGKHVITFNYMPQHMYIGYGAAIVAIGFIGFAYRRTWMDWIGRKETEEPSAAAAPKPTAKLKPTPKASKPKKPATKKSKAPAKRRKTPAKKK